jgi:hypothetical protein
MKLREKALERAAFEDVEEDDEEDDGDEEESEHEDGGDNTSFEHAQKDEEYFQQDIEVAFLNDSTVIDHNNQDTSKTKS